jgi:hypothetical protein
MLTITYDHISVSLSLDCLIVLLYPWIEKIALPNWLFDTLYTKDMTAPKDATQLENIRIEKRRTLTTKERIRDTLEAYFYNILKFLQKPRTMWVKYEQTDSLCWYLLKNLFKGKRYTSG